MGNGLAFSGGGMKFFAHIGVLKALEEMNIKFDYISGTSSGSVIAFLYAIGMKPEEMLKIISEKYSEVTKMRIGKVVFSTIESMLNGKFQINCLIDGEGLENLIKDVLEKQEYKYKKISDIDKNLAIISCDTITTKEIVFLSKEYNLEDTNRITYLKDVPIEKAIRASMSFPGIFTPCKYNEFDLIDGGTVNNLPSKILKQMGADKVLGVSFKLNQYEPKDSIMDVALRAADIFSILNMSVANEYTDISLELEIPETGLLNIENVKKVYELGYNQTIKLKDELTKVYC